MRTPVIHAVHAVLTLLPPTLATPGSTQAMPQPNITLPDPQVPLAPSPLPSPGPATHGAEIAAQLTTLTRSNISRLRLVKKVHLQGDLWEPEGIVRLAHPSAAEGDERFWVSAGEYTVPTEKYPGGQVVDGTDRSAGAGFAHFVVFDGKGTRLGDWVVSGEGDLEYHNGGLDYDGAHIWATLSQYRPNTTGTVVKIDPAGLRMEKVFKVADHQGGIVHDAETGSLATLNWGGRKARRWNLRPAAIVDGGQRPLADAHEGEKDEEGKEEGAGAGFDSPTAEVVNPSHWIDYQDCKSLGRVGSRPVMLCSGIATLAAGVDVGGLAIVDVETMVPIWEVPFMERTEEGKRVLMTKNPMDVALVGGRVRLYFSPEEGRSTLYVYELGE